MPYTYNVTPNDIFEVLEGMGNPVSFDELRGFIDMYEIEQSIMEVDDCLDLPETLHKMREVAKEEIRRQITEHINVPGVRR